MENGAVKLDENLLSFTVLNQEVALFDFGNVLVRKDYKESDKVRLIAGGSTFYEKFVGKGMLTAAIQGENGEAPTSKLILRVLRELSVNHYMGILVIIQGDSSDMLSFGLAVERATNDGLGVMILRVSEDALNREFSKTNKRGLSGIVLILKIAGAMAEEGTPLSEIYEFCSKVIENMSSSATHINKRFLDGECIICNKCTQDLDNEPNLKKSNLILLEKKSKSIIDTQEITYNKIVNELYTNILNEGKVKLDTETNNLLVILINNQGGLNKNEEYLFVKEVVLFFQSCGLYILRMYVGNFLNLNYQLNLTFTMLKVSYEDILKYLDQSCNVPAWKSANQHLSYLTLKNTILPGSLKRKCRLSPPTKGPRLKDRATNVLQVALQFACDAIISCCKMLNKIDAERGDGDTGTRLKNVAEVLHKRIRDKKLVLNCPFTFFLSLSKILENTVSGTSGCIYGILFEAAANKFGQCNDEEEVTPQIWLEALEHGCQSVKKFGNVDLGDQTMYDSLYACAVTVRENLIEKAVSYLQAYELGVNAAEKAAQNTKREGYKYPDPGAHAVGIWMRAVFEGVKLRCSD